MSKQAWVTLATNDSYALGALVLAHSLRRVGSTASAVVLITPSVTEPMRDRLSAVFTEVLTVDVLDSRDATHLALLQRPELGITFTKLHCWNLTQYDKCVFLDADTLIVQNCDELFEREELSAAPDVGWPDCFNSGVFVFKPSTDTFSKLIKFAEERGSFDGGDQGVLNAYFSDWAHGDINKHLPFLYNVTSAAFYSYIPALKQYGQNLKIIHFIGAAKPWLQRYNWRTNSVEAPDHIQDFLQLWWSLFVAEVHTKLDTAMTGVAGHLARVSEGYQSEAIDELARRQGWEAGNIDYMGADSFDNIWAKISKTLSQAPSPPKQQSPPVASVQPATKPQESPVTSEAVSTAKPEVAPKEAPVVASTIVSAPTAKDIKPSPIEEPLPVPVEEAAKEVISTPKVPVREDKTESPSDVPVTALKALKLEETSKSDSASSVKSVADSPPLVSTPSTEEVPKAPVTKTTEEAAEETRL